MPLPQVWHLATESAFTSTADRLNSGVGPQQNRAHLGNVFLILSSMFFIKVEAQNGVMEH